MTAEPQTPIPVVERLGFMLRHLIVDIAASLSWGGITQPVLAVVFRRLNGNKARIERIVALIRAGTYKLRRPASAPREPRAPGTRPPRPRGPLPAKSGWLLPYLPPAWRGAAGTLNTLLGDPEMVALIEAAPVSLGRPLRSLCWAVKLRPPPFLAPPRRPRVPKAPPAETPPPDARDSPPPRRPPPEVLARWPHAAPLLKRAGLERWREPNHTRGAPKPA